MRIPPYFMRVVPSFWEHGRMKAENGMNTELASGGIIEQL